MEDEKRQGFAGTLQAQATVNLVSNKSVVGQTDGMSTLLGIGLLGGLDYIHQRHVWSNTFQLSEAWARTPVLPEFVKSDDMVSIESLYNYFLLSWAGAFARADVTTALLRTWAITAEPVDYAITDRNGEPLAISTPVSATTSASANAMATPQVGVWRRGWTRPNMPGTSLASAMP